VGEAGARFRFLASWLTGLVLTLTATALGQQPVSGGSLTIAIDASPRSLESIIDPGLPGIFILNNTEEGLLGFDNDGNIVPVLAAAMPDNPDPLTYIFHLRQGVRFQSGDEMTAEDVVFTYERLYEPDSRASFASIYQQNLANVEALDKYTVKMTLKQPFPIFLSFVAGNHTKVVDKSFVEAAGKDYGVTKWDGTGPFKIVDWVKDSHVTLEKNPYYWQAGKPYLDKIVVQIIPEPSTQLANFQTGAVDLVLNPSFSQLDVYKSVPNASVLAGQGASETLLVFRTANAPVNDARVRRAISLGIDRKALVATVLRGYGVVGGSIFPPGHWAYDPSLAVTYDPDTAKQLLDQAGYNQQHPLALTILTINEPFYQDQAVLIQRQLAQIGVKVTVRPLEYTTISSLTKGPQKDWGGDAAIYRITPLRGTAYEFSWYQYDSSGPLNRSRYNIDDGAKDQKVEDLLNAAAKLSDYIPSEQAKARPMYEEANKLILEDAPQLVLNFWDTVNVASDRVKGFVPSPVNTPLLGDVWLAH